MALISSANPTILPIPGRTPGHRNRPKPKNVLKSQTKAQKAKRILEEPPPIPDENLEFINRFFALPQEIRNNVYRQLLVRPCKFDMHHALDCDGKGISGSRPGPTLISEGAGYSMCACCNDSDWKRTQQVETCIFKSPARSQWGVQGNEFLCDMCYWDIVGNYEGKPCMKSLHCLCTRHDQLQILLVSRRFYDEAAPIFWGENIFAFEYPCLLEGLLSNIRPHVRSWIRRISFLPLHDHVFYDNPDPLADLSLYYLSHTDAKENWQGWDRMKQCWQLLRLCDGLTELELDVLFLKRLDESLLLRMVKVARKTTFFRHPRQEEIVPHRTLRHRKVVILDDTPWVWWSHSRRIAVSTPTTRLIESSMVGSRSSKAKEVKRHWAETDPLTRYGGEIYPGVLED